MSKKRRKPKVTPSCGCIFCDLDLPPITLPDGQVVHTHRIGRGKNEHVVLEPCRKGQAPNDDESDNTDVADE